MPRGLALAALLLSVMPTLAMASDSRDSRSPTGVAGIVLEPSDILGPADCEELGFIAEGVDCAWLFVPERHDPPTGRAISLPVAVLRATGGAPTADPIVYLPGGPGAGGLDALGAWLGSPLREARDIVLFDPRGTGEAMPSLGCRGLDAYDVFISLDPPLPADLEAGWLSAAADCRVQLEEADVDLGAYSTLESAHDVDALRAALGVGSWNLYGVSYGTRLGLEVLRQHPAGVRAAVLDSVLPPDVNLYEASAADLAAVLEAVHAACAADRACAERFGDLDTLLQRAERRWADRRRFVTVPDTMGTPYAASIGPDTPRQALHAALLAARPESIPIELEALATGNTAFLEIGPVASAAATEALRLQVQCSEYYAHADPAIVAADLAAHPDVASTLALRDEPIVCPTWGSTPAPLDQRRPVRNEGPTLLIAGALDPLTPPRYAEAALAGLPDGQLALLAGRGHGVSLGDECTLEMVSSFLAAPSDEVDTACAEATSIGFIVDVVPNRGLAHFLLDLIKWPRGDQNPSMAVPLTGIVGVTLAIALLIGAVRLVRWDRSLATWMLVATCVAWLGFGAGVGVVWMRALTAPDASVLLFGLPASVAPLLWLPWLAAAATVCLGVLAARGWLCRGSSRRVQVLQAVALVASLGAFGLAIGYGVVGVG